MSFNFTLILFQNNPLHSGITFKGKPHLTLGGVGRNLACAIEFLGHEPSFITSLGNDNLAFFALNEFHKNGLTLESRRLKLSTSSSNGLDKTVQSCCFALVLVDSITGLSEYVIADLDAIKAIDCKTIDINMDSISSAPLLVMDANLESETIRYLIEICHKHKVPIFLEPTDKLALPRLVDSFKSFKDNNAAACLHSILCISPNLIELKTMIRLFNHSCDNYNEITNDIEESSYTSLEEVQEMAELLMNTYMTHLRCLLVTMDKRGVLVGIRTTEDNYNHNCEIDELKLMNQNLLMEDKGKLSKTSNHDGVCTKNNGKSFLHFKHFPTPARIEKPISGSGAGDSFAAGFISGLLTNSSLVDCLNKGFKASLLTLNDKNNVSPKLKDLSVKENKMDHNVPC